MPSYERFVSYTTPSPCARRIRRQGNRLHRRPWFGFAVVLLGAITHPACRQPDHPAAMWLCRDVPTRWDRPYDASTPAGVSPAATNLTLSGAINETLSFCLAVRPQGAPIEQPAFRIAPLASDTALVDSSAVRLYRMQPVRLGAFPGWHVRSIPQLEREMEPLDVLVPVRAPRGGLPATLRPDETYCFWADVTIPKGTADGTYTTVIELRCGDAVAASVQVTLTVWPFVLPDQAVPAVLAELDHRALFNHHIGFGSRSVPLPADDWRADPRRSELDALLHAALRMVQGHRLTPVLPELTPRVHVGDDGGLEIDWSAYDAVVEPCLDGRAFFNRIPLTLWPLPLHRVLSATRPRGVALSAKHQALLQTYVAQCAEHFAGKGWLERAYALPPRRSGTLIESAEAARSYLIGASAADARIPVVSRLFPQDMAPLGWEGYPHARLWGEPTDHRVDVWMPPAQFYDPEAMGAQRAAGRRTWLQVDRPPFSGTLAVAAPPTYARVLTWQARALEASALAVGCINRWPETSEHGTPEHCVAADPSVLLYPGQCFGLAEPVPSVRLKRLRRSLQDAAYQSLLEQHGLEHVTTALRRSLAPYAGTDAYRTHFADGRPIGWVDDPSLFESARHVMADALMRASFPQADLTQSDLFARSAVWRRFMLSARRVRVYVDGVQLRPSGAGHDAAADIECAITIVNGRRTPIGGLVRFSKLPDGWSEAEPVAVAPIAPNSSRRLSLVAKAATMPIRGGGSFVLPIEFIESTAPTSPLIDAPPAQPVPHKVGARVSYLVAAPATRPIRIDGDLSDWPPGSTNVASDFQLITGRHPEAEDDRAARPGHGTMAFVMRDEDRLYVAVNCETTAGIRTVGPTARCKAVTYDDLIPVGAELIELLIDPFHTGTRSPSDLYHIVVKRSGSDLTEKGIRFEPPCGAREPWAVDLDVATSVSDGRWTAELAIPLAALGSPVIDGTTWGFSVTRYDAFRQEYSTWSGAVRNAYDPLSLGNLHLPAVGDVR